MYEFRLRFDRTPKGSIGNMPVHEPMLTRFIGAYGTLGGDNYINNIVIYTGTMEDARYCYII